MKITNPLSRISLFLKSGIWEIDLKKETFVTAVCIRCLRVILLAIHGFIKNECQKTASVFTYYSILNAVPLVAVAFAIAKGFGLEKLVRRQILEMADKAQWQSNITSQILGFSGSLLEQAKGGFIAGLGIILLFYTVITILGKIEDSFNKIWNVKKSRTLIRKLSDYLAILVLAPILLVLSSSVTVVVSSKLGEIIRVHPLLGGIGPAFFFLLSLLPYVSIWALLTAIYLVMPNTRVPVRSAVAGGIAAGTIYHFVQWAYIKFQIGVSSYGAIYGSFAALPLFLIWLQISWTIVLFGAELVYADRHFKTFGYKPEYDDIRGRVRKQLALRIFRLLVMRFSTAESRPTLDELACTLAIPVRLVQDILTDLIYAGLVVEVMKAETGGMGFQPARSIENISVKDVIDVYEETDKNILPQNSGEVCDRILTCLKEMDRAMENSPGNMKIKDI